MHSLIAIDKKANFRSAPAIIKVLNNIRPELPQREADPRAKGFVSVYHTNAWTGTRLTGQHWAGDLPPEVTHRYLEKLIGTLSSENWSFEATKTKVLMLTQRALAAEQGYKNLLGIFKYNDALFKKEDPHIAFFVDTLEPVCEAFQNKRFGEMFAALGIRTATIKSHADKMLWHLYMH